MCSALPLALGFAFEALGLRSCPPAHVSALLEVREPETFFSPGRIPRLRGGGAWRWRPRVLELSRK